MESSSSVIAHGKQATRLYILASQNPDNRLTPMLTFTWLSKSPQPWPSVTTVFLEQVSLLPFLVSHSTKISKLPKLRLFCSTPAEVPLPATVKHHWIKQANKNLACTVLFPPRVTVADTIKPPEQPTRYSRSVLKSSGERNLLGAVDRAPPRSPTGHAYAEQDEQNVTALGH